MTDNENKCLAQQQQHSNDDDNRYFDDNGNMNFTYRDDNPAGSFGTGSVFITTRDGSMHFIAYSNDPALVDTNTGSNLNETV